MDPHALSPTISLHAEDLWRRRDIVASYPAESPPSADVISSLITSLSEALETVPDLNNDHTEYWTSQVNAMQGISQDRYEFPLPPDGITQPYPSNTATPPIIRTSKPPPSHSPLITPKTKSSRGSLRPNHSESQIQNEGYSAQSEMVTHGFGKLSIEPNARHSSLRASEIGGSSKLRSPKRTSSRMREMDREWKRNPLNPANEVTKNSSKRLLNARSIESSPVSPSLPMNESFGPDVRLSLPTIPARGSSIRSTLDTNKVIGAVQNNSGGITGVVRVPTRDSSLRYSSNSTPPRRKRRSQQSSQESKSGVKKLPSSVSDSSMNYVERVLDETTEDDVTRRIQELRAQKDRRSRQFIEDSQSSVVDNLSLLSLPIGSCLRRTISKESCGLQDTRSQHNLTTKFNDSVSRPSKVQSEVTAKKSVHPVEASSSPAQAKSALQALSSSQVKHLSGSVGSGLPRAFSNPLSQVTWTSQYDDRLSTADSVDEAIEDYLFSYRLSQKIQHPQTGRIISFSEVGDPDGYAVFCCVGMGLTRYVTAFYDELALKLKLRLITPERPGIGESEAHADGSDTPLGWPDDILQICQHLEITRFSLLAHSAGAVYALATALRIPQFIRGRIHLLAPWIPPSQMATPGTHQEPLPLSALPYSQRILRALPISFLKAANSSFLSTTSASVTTSLGKSSRRTKRKSTSQDTSLLKASPMPKIASRSQQPSPSFRPSTSDRDTCITSDFIVRSTRSSMDYITEVRAFATERQTDYDSRLTRAIWDLATMDSNPAIDLVVCLERRQAIGFRYVDVGKAIVIHHGSKDSRVPVDNVKWLGNVMRRCEVRILEGEGHGLMASATVMGDVLVEMAKEWEDWNLVVQGKRSMRKS